MFKRSFPIIPELPQTEIVTSCLVHDEWAFATARELVLLKEGHTAPRRVAYTDMIEIKIDTVSMDQRFLHIVMCDAGAALLFLLLGRIELAALCVLGIIIILAIAQIERSCAIVLTRQGLVMLSASLWQRKSFGYFLAAFQQLATPVMMATARAAAEAQEAAEAQAEESDESVKPILQ